MAIYAVNFVVISREEDTVDVEAESEDEACDKVEMEYGAFAEEFEIINVANLSEDNSETD